MSDTRPRRGFFRTLGLFFTDRDKLEPLVISLLAGTMSLLVGVLLIAVASKDPLTSITNFLLGPVLKTYNLYYVMVMMVPLTFAGLALCIVYQARYLTLIIDSTFYMGAVLAAAVGILVPLPTGLHPVVAMLVSGLAGGLIGMIPAVLKLKWRANELVSSIMLNYVFYFLGSCIIIYLLRDRSQTILASVPFLESFRLPKLVPNTQLHAGFLIAAGLIVAVSIYLYRTKWGYQIRMVGANPQFAAYTGFTVGGVVLGAHFVSGFIGGMGGAVEMAGMYKAFIWQMDPSYAWDGVIVAMLARRNPKFVPVSALFLAYIRVGADFMSRRGDVAFEFITLVQGVIILILASDTIVNYFRTKRLKAQALKQEKA
jgi:ABC-type uncharacterized transport system permease subunit